MRPASTDPTPLLALVLSGGPTAPLRALLEQQGSAAAVLAAGPPAWRMAGCSAAQCQAISRPEPQRLARSLAWLEDPAHHLVGWHAADYPPLLRDSPQPPLALFVDGDPLQLWRPAIALVGSRMPSAGGRDSAGDFATALAGSGLVVASGLAAGIDAAVHRAVLAGAGGTYAVIGTGPDLAYPRHHRELQAQVAGRGAVVSEYPPGTPPRSGQFPARNRLLAGLTLGTVVVEAAERSGALITARLASEAGREVFAVPGSIRNPMARSCHRLIRDGATLATCAEDILEGVANLAGELAGVTRGMD